jgi:hypothetical protein
MSNTAYLYISLRNQYRRGREDFRKGSQREEGGLFAIAIIH